MVPVKTKSENRKTNGKCFTEINDGRQVSEDYEETDEAGQRFCSPDPNSNPVAVHAGKREQSPLKALSQSEQC